MPPKKGKGKKEKKAPAPPEYIPEKPLSENDKKFYTMQIDLLEKQFEKYQQKCNELKLRQQAELDQVKTLEQDFEMLKYAKKQVEQKDEEILDLRDRLVGLGQAKEMEKEMLQKQLNDLKNEIHDLRERYEAENSELRNQVADLEIFRAKQDSYLARRQQQQDTLKFREEEHVRKLAEIERKDQIDRDRLKKEMIQKMNHVAAEFRRASNKQMAETTKRTINENARIEQTVTDMEDVSMRVKNENENIDDNNKQMRTTIETLKSKEQKHAFQHATSAEIIQLLANMLQNQEEIIVSKQEQVAQMDVAERRMKELRSLIFNNEKNYPEIRQQNRMYHEKIERLDQLIGERTAEKQQLLSTIRRAVTLVTESLKIKDAEKKALVPKLDSASADEYAVPENNENLFQELYQILTSTEPMNDDDDDEQRKTTDDQTTGFQFKDSGKRRENLSYSLGDMGFVPRRDAILLTNFDKMQQQVYPTRERETIRRAAKISVAVQTPGLARGSFGSDMSINRLAPYDNTVDDKTREQFNRPNFGTRPRIPRGMTATNRVMQYLF